MLEITVNGQGRAFAPPMKVVQLLQQMQLGDKRVAVERNGEIIPRSQYDAVDIESGDHFEIVVAVGGG